MFYVDIALCVLSVVFIFWMAWLILKRNRTVECKGRDDYLAYAIVIILMVVHFQLTEDEDYLVIAALRNSMIYMAFFSCLLPRRGISEKGMVMALFTIPWSEITDLRVEEYMTSKLQVVFMAYNFKHKLLFNRARTREVVATLQKFQGDVYIHQSLDPYLQQRRR